MVDLANFKIWLTEKTDYSDKTISNIVSRFKRANTILPWKNDPLYFFYLDQNEDFKNLSCDIRSQIKKAVKLYNSFIESTNKNTPEKEGNKLNILSLFSNIGVAEAYLESIGMNVAVANELIERRAKLYSRIYPNTHMICGDITNSSIYELLLTESKKAKIDIILATPPCQGMSTAGQQLKDDERNKLICPVVDLIKELSPKYVFIENVPQFLSTKIIVKGEEKKITDYLSGELSEKYIINIYTIDTKDYSVPQSRERAILLLSRKDLPYVWEMPNKDKKLVTMRDAIGYLPTIDPFITDVSEDEFHSLFPEYESRKKEALSISEWNIPPHHVKRQVVAMMHTPTGCTAFDNKVYYPVKENGEPVKGYHNTYKRQNWDTAAYTVTMDNRKISSQDNVHPGRFIGFDENGDVLYSDARTLTLYELMIIMSLPKDWPVPSDISEAFLRRIIGEGIPPLFVKKVFEELQRGLKYGAA